MLSKQPGANRESVDQQRSARNLHCTKCERSNLNMNENETPINLSSYDRRNVKLQSSVSRPHFWFTIKSEYTLVSKIQF